MVKKNFVALSLFSFFSLSSMEPVHVIEMPRIEIDGQPHRDSEELKDNEELLAFRNAQEGRHHTIFSPVPTSPSPSLTPKFHPVSPEPTDQNHLVDNQNETTRNISSLAREKLESFSHPVSFSPHLPRVATPEPIQAHDKEIAALIEDYKAAHEALPLDAIRDIRLQNEYQGLVNAKLKAIEHLKQSSGIGDFPDQSEAIIARQEQLIHYLKEKIESLKMQERLEVRQALEKATDALIADLEQNLSTSKIKNKDTLYKINVLLDHMREERNLMKDKTLLTDPKFDVMMNTRQWRIQGIGKEIEELMSPNPSRAGSRTSPGLRKGIL